MAIVISGYTYLNGALTLDGTARAPADDVGPGGLVRGYPYGDDRLFGDVETLTGFARGGDDVMTGGPEFVPFIGDARLIEGSARGGNDVISFSAFGGEIYGDALTIRGFGTGGDDRLSLFVRGGTAYGDSFAMTGFARGGNDDITVGGRFMVAYGDARTLGGHARGGDDVFHGGGDTTTTFIGDGALSGHARGGDDTLYAPARDNGVTLMGDGPMSDHARGGDDLLVAGGRGIYYLELWGDGPVTGTHTVGGHDRFVLQPGSYKAVIMDFEPHRDVLDLSAFAANGVHALHDIAVTDTAEGLQLDGIVTLKGVHALGAHDIVFA